MLSTYNNLFLPSTYLARRGLRREGEKVEGYPSYTHGILARRGRVREGEKVEENPPSTYAILACSLPAGGGEGKARRLNDILKD